MKDLYVEAARKISELADEYSEDYHLSTILRVGSVKITGLAQEKTGLILKNAQKEHDKCSTDK